MPKRPGGRATHFFLIGVSFGGCPFCWGAFKGEPNGSNKKFFFFVISYFFLFSFFCGGSEKNKYSTPIAILDKELNRFCQLSRQDVEAGRFPRVHDDLANQTRHGNGRPWRAGRGWGMPMWGPEIPWVTLRETHQTRFDFCFGELSHGHFHLLKNMFFPPLGLKGIYHYWKHVLFFPGVLSKWRVTLGPNGRFFSKSHGRCSPVWNILTRLRGSWLAMEDPTPPDTPGIGVWGSQHLAV